MIQLQWIKHRDCDDQMLRRICEFKRLNWDYPTDSQLEWLKTNLEKDDIHLLMVENDRFVGYLNIVNLILYCDGTPEDAYGIGNVCIHPKYKGLSLGALIMASARYYCRVNRKVGVLFCQDKNVGFYDACNWHRHEGRILNNSIGAVHLNFYSTKALNCGSVECNRDF